MPATARLAAPRAMTVSTSWVLDTHTCSSMPCRLKLELGLNSLNRPSVTAGLCTTKKSAASRAMLWLQDAFLPEAGALEYLASKVTSIRDNEQHSRGH